MIGIKPFNLVKEIPHPALSCSISFIDSLLVITHFENLFILLIKLFNLVKEIPHPALRDSEWQAILKGEGGSRGGLMKILIFYFFLRKPPLLPPLPRKVGLSSRTKWEISRSHLLLPFLLLIPVQTAPASAITPKSAFIIPSETRDLPVFIPFTSKQYTMSMDIIRYSMINGNTSGSITEVPKNF